MNDVKLGLILEDACRLAGRDPLDMPIPPGWKVLAAMSMNAGIRDLAAEKFPMMQRVEFRRYRPMFSDAVRYDVGHEVWWNGDYWRYEDDIPGMPGEDNGWRKLSMEELNAFIDWEQPWENTVMDPAGVDFSRFAFLADPRYNPSATPIPGCGVCELGLVVPSPAPKGVYVKFVPVYPNINFVEWEAEREYYAGDVVYRSQTKDVYQAVVRVAAGTSAPETEKSGIWQPVTVRREFRTYLTRLVAADLMTEDQGKYQTQGAALRELETLRERYHDGIGSNRVRVGSFCR